MTEALLKTRLVEKTATAKEAPSEKMASPEAPPQKDVLERTVLEKSLLEQSLLEKIRRDSQAEPKEYIAEVVAGGGE